MSRKTTMVAAGLDGAWRKACIALWIAAAMWSMGCGDQDPCAEVDCEFGACDSESGECANVQDCQVSDDCVPGYECEAQTGSCEAVSECSSDKDCDAGVCNDDGVCVNPQSCEDNDDCLERSYCADDGTCRWDPCNDKACQRGECKRGTDQCVSADSCTEETELYDCVAGEKCADGTCRDAEDFCDALECERGECSFEEGGCANASDCDGDDDKCAEGYFCNGEDVCRRDLCEEEDVDCGDNGQCQPATGTCENVEPCEDDEDCLSSPEHLCLDGECRLLDLACGDGAGDGGCPGNRTCVVEDDSAECEEPDQCETSLDCAGDRECGGWDCLEARDCREDRFEPNDTSDEATDFFEAAYQRRLRASACADDTDIYTFHTEDILGPSERGRLLVDVEVPRRDRGLGSLEAELSGSQGGTRRLDTGADGREGHLQFEQEIGVDDHDRFTLEISAGDDMSRAGVDYEVGVALLPRETVEACNEARELQAGQRVGGNTDDSKSTYLDAECLEHGEESGEVVYEIDNETAQEYRFELVPQLSGADLSMSLRTDCAHGSTETACVDQAAEGEEETLETVLAEGTYYLVVQSGDEGHGGPFELSAEALGTACGPGGDFCESTTVSNRCASGGGRYEPIECDQGCNASTGRCYPPTGDHCSDAPVLAPEEEDGEPELPQTTEQSIDLRQLSDNYRVDGRPEACEQVTESRSEGPDRVYEVELPAQVGFEARVDYAEEGSGSLYVLEECDDTGESCLAGAAGSGEEANVEQLAYGNATDDTESVYLVVDSDSESALKTAELELTYDEVVCDPGDDQCGEGDVEVCADSGLNYETTESCEDFGCEESTCLFGDDCDDAHPLGDGDSITRTFGGMSDDLSTGTGQRGACEFGDNNNGDQEEHVYAIDMEEDEVLTVTYESGIDELQTAEGIVYMLEDCSDPDSCVMNHGWIESSAHPFDMNYQADSDGTYYLVVTRDSGSDSSYDYRLDIDVSEPDCDPDSDASSCMADDEVEFCNEYGQWETATCLDCDDGDCSSGETCSEAIPIEDGQTDRKAFDSDENHLTTGQGDVGLCTFDEDNDGDDEEFIYEIDLEEDDFLEVTYESGVDLGMTEQGVMYLLEDCDDVESCLQNHGRIDQDSQPFTFDYMADEDETLYLVVSRNGGNYYMYDYELGVDITATECDPDQQASRCTDGDTVQHCEHPGVWGSEMTCNAGCSDGACNDPDGAGDTCSDTIDATPLVSSPGTTTLTGNLGDYTHHIEEGSSPCPNENLITVADLSGPDVIYTLDMEDGDEVTATMEIDGDVDPAVIIQPGCTNLNDTCYEAYADYLGDGSAEASHTASQDETVYIVADSDSNVADDDYTLELDIE